MHQEIGEIIRKKREEKGLTQAQLAKMLGVTAKAVSKWETGAGLPDVSLFEPLSTALSLSVAELFSGETVKNHNRAANMMKTRFYVCPVCGNVVHSVGEIAVSCCGVTLPPLVAEEADEAHRLSAIPVEDEWFVESAHPMEKDHFLSFAALVQSERVTLVKWYPEGAAQARFPRRGHGILYTYCAKHGLTKQKL